MLAIYKRELRSYFKGAIGYVFLVVYLAVAAVVFAYSNLFAMSSHMTAFYTFMLLFSAIALPLLTMKSFSEEKKTKTEQLLLTAPISLPAMVFGKFLAAYTVFAAVSVFTSLYFLLLIPYTQLQVGVWLGNIVAQLLVGMVFITIGLFISSVTENQLSSAIGTIAVILGFLGIGLLNNLLPTTFFLRYVLDAISIFSRFQSFTSGYFELSSLIYYLSVSGIFLWLTIRIYDRRRYS
ncbi:MAG: ABC transporter permease subunit [Clostridia bacterium]|nr:ABC transporter permease subunit [Clostridia bacterium]